jgi:hypothetical protein
MRPFSSLFFLTRLAAPPRTVVALWSIDILLDRVLLELALELGGEEEGRITTSAFGLVEEGERVDKRDESSWGGSLHFDFW